MTQEEIKIGNELILNYMGYLFDGKYYLKDGRRKASICYHSDWNELMKVIDKISNDEIVNRIKIDYGVGCFIEYNIILGLEENNYIIDTTIMSTFKKVIGFIKNKQNERNN